MREPFGEVHAGTLKREPFARFARSRVVRAQVLSRIYGFFLWFPLDVDLICVRDAKIAIQFFRGNFPKSNSGKIGQISSFQWYGNVHSADTQFKCGGSWSAN